VHRIFPNYVIRMWMKTKDDGLAAVLYGPSKVQAMVGPDSEPIEIIQATNYPFDEQIQFKIHCSRAVTFALSLRIPAWCAEPRLSVNGASADTSPRRGGFLVLRRRFNPDDVVTLTLPMQLAATHWPQNGIGIERGPLVYSLPIKENWTAIAEPGYSTAEYPSWEARPASAWNYGLAVDPAKLATEVEINTRSLTQNELGDPWGNPSTTLSVSARRIEGWELQTNSADASQKLTPPLPDVGASKVSEAIERVVLVPYGSTQLRVTVFPWLR